MRLLKTGFTALFTMLTMLSFAGAQSGIDTLTARDSQRTSLFVMAHAHDLVDDKLTDEQVTALRLIAHQAAVSTVCVGFVIDENKFSEAFGALEHPADAEMSDAEKAYFDQHVLVIYGIMVGGALSSAAHDVSGFCAHAEEERADSELAGDLLWK